jgi:hypothetical protein
MIFPMAGKITIEKLAIMIQAQFEHIDQRFERMEERMNHMESTMVTKDDLSGVETRLMHRIDRLEDRMRIVETRLDHLNPVAI